MHLSIINSFYTYQIQFSPRGDIFVSYCPSCLLENQNAISKCMSGESGREYFTIVTSRPRDFSVELKIRLECPYCFNVLDSNVLFTKKKVNLFEAINRNDKF